MGRIGLFWIAVLACAALLALWVRQRWRRFALTMEDAERRFEREVLQAQASREGPAPEEAPTPAAPSAPAPAERLGLEASLAGHVAALRRKMDIAGLLEAGEEEVAVPGLAEPARLARLRNRKTVLIAPAQAPGHWVEAMLRQYDYVVVAGEPHARVLRQFEDFLVDYMFRQTGGPPG